MKNILRKLKKDQFILSIGDEGVILGYFEKGALKERLFRESIEGVENSDFAEILKKYPKAPIEIFFDGSEQFYRKVELPGVNVFSISGLVNKKIKRDYSEKDITAALMINQSKSMRKNWNYVFVNMPFEGMLADWIDFLLSLKNPLKGVYLLPVEARKVALKLNDKFFPNLNKENHKLNMSEKVNWQLLLIHNKIGGFREIAFVNGKVFFSRIVSADNSQSVNFTAGAIEQELVTIVDFLKTQGLKDAERLDIFTLTSAEIKQNISEKLNFCTNLVKVTPFELGQILSLSGIPETDSFGDVAMMTAFANLPREFKLNVKQMRMLNFLEMTNAKINFPALIGLPIIILYLGMIIWSNVENKANLGVLQQKLTGLKEAFEQKEKAEMTLSEASRITDIISLYKLVKVSGVSPVEMVSKFLKIQQANISVKSIDWSMAERILKGKKEQVAKMTLDVEFQNAGGNYQKLFNDFDEFIKQINEEFKGYEVEYSRINEQINFNEVKQSIPVKLIITGP